MITQDSFYKNLIFVFSYTTFTYKVIYLSLILFFFKGICGCWVWVLKIFIRLQKAPNPTKHLCVLVSVRLWHLIFNKNSVVLQKMHFSVLFRTNLYSIFFCTFNIMIKKNDAETSHYTGVIWDEYSEQHQHHI